jgi:predicted nuclease of predicted toxin-antitoxin system
MKIVIDMNLSPQWVEVLMSEGHDCVHCALVISVTEGTTK